jgi:hypothetical protein
VNAVHNLRGGLELRRTKGRTEEEEEEEEEENESA